MAGNNLNARPTNAFNQRPSTPPTKSSVPKNPYANLARAAQTSYAQHIAGESKQLQPKTLEKRAFGAPAAPMRTSEPVRPQPMSAPANNQHVSNTVSSASNNRATIPDSDMGEEVTTAASLIATMRQMIGPFAILNDKVIQKNVNLAAGLGMTNDDRTISFECAAYLMNNFGYIIMGLVIDQSFKDSFADAVLIEMNMDSKSAADQKKARDAMKGKVPFSSEGAMVFGVTQFIPKVTKQLMSGMQSSFDALEAYGPEFDKTVESLSHDYKLELGFIFSNFMYLVRAFTHNDLFMSYVVTVVEKIKNFVAKNH